MSTAAASTPRKGADWLETWDPETAWDSGRAWKTLWITTFNLTLAFITWFLVSAIAPQLNFIGFNLTTGQLYWLAAMPGLAGGLLRLVWMFLPPIMGTRKLVWISSLLLVIPLFGWAQAVQNPGTSYAVLLMLAFLAGIGGGVFSGFMPSTSYFFPKAKQGTALGIQAGIGNFGVSVVQFVTPWIIGFALIGGSQAFNNEPKNIHKEVWYQNAGYVWIPFVIVGVILAYTLLKSVPVQARGVKDQLDIFGNKHTWIMTWLYILTFGTFSGMAAQFALLMKNLYGTPFGENGIIAVQYAFLGALIGSAARVLAGPVADRVGGGKVTMIAVLGIAFSALYTSFTLAPTSVDEFPKFLWGMLAVFFFSGVGNASTFKQMPMIFERRQAGGVIGWTAAIAAFGPFIFGVMFATAHAQMLFWLGFVSCLSGAVITWYYYARPGAEKPS